MAPHMLPQRADESQGRHSSAGTAGTLPRTGLQTAAPITASPGAAATTRDLSEISPRNYSFLEAETTELEAIQVNVADGRISSCHFSKESWQG